MSFNEPDDERDILPFNVGAKASKTQNNSRLIAWLFLAFALTGLFFDWPGILVLASILLTVEYIFKGR